MINLIAMFCFVLSNNSFARTNVLWLIYLVDILLTKKSFVSLQDTDNY